MIDDEILKQSSYKRRISARGLIASGHGTRLPASSVVLEVAVEKHGINISTASSRTCE